MNKSGRWLLRLYPRGWRERYERELEALIDDSRMTSADWVDVAKGGMMSRSRSFVGRSAWQIVLVFVLVGAIVGGIVSQMMRRIYVSEATVITDANSAELNSLITGSLSRNYLGGLINSLRLYPQDAARMPLEDVVARMRRDIRVSNVSGLKGASAFSVAFVHENPLTAQLVTNELVSHIMANNVRVRSDSARTLKVIDPVTLPISPISPNVRNVVIAGALGGLMVGALLVALTARVRGPHHHSA